MQRHLGVVFLMMGLLAGSRAVGQPAGSIERELDLQAHLFGGLLSSDTLIETRIGGERVTGRADSGIMTGLRLGADEEYSGWELTLAAVVSDVEIKADPFATSFPPESDSSLVLGTLNLLLYPTGNSMADGRVRPFVTVGGGLGYLAADEFDELDGELLYDVNSGFGIKFLMGQTGDPVLRVDWRWHFMEDFSAEFDNIYRQEISVGIGMRF